MRVGAEMGVMSYDIKKMLKKIAEGNGKYQDFERCGICGGRGRKEIDGKLQDCPKCGSWGFYKRG